MLRLATTRAEELRVGLGDAVQAREAALLQLRNHQAEMAAEIAPQCDSNESIFDFARWQRTALQTERALLASLNERMAAEEALRDQLRDNIGDQKRLGIAIETIKNSEDQRETRRRELAQEEIELQRTPHV